MHPDQVEQLLAAVGEVLAQGVADVHPQALHLEAEQLGDQGHASPAAGAGAGALLHVADGVGPAADGAADGALVDVVARADDGRVRQPAYAHRRRSDPAAVGEDELLGVVGRGHVAPDHLHEGLVEGRVADQHPADDGAPVLAVGRAHHQPLVDVGQGVAVGDGLGPGGGGEGVAEAGHVDAEELELGRHVGAQEGGVAAQDAIGHHPGHVVAGGDQAVDPAPGQAAVGGEGALADGVDLGVGRAAGVVDDDPAPLPHRQPGRLGQLVPGPDAGREDDHADLEVVDRSIWSLVGEVHALHPAPPVAEDLLRPHPGVDGHAQLVDAPAEGGRTGVVDLHGHEPVGELDHVGLQAEAVQGVGRLQPEQPAADHRARPAVLGVVPDRLQVVEGAVDEAPGGVVAGQRGDERVGAGGQDEGVVGDLDPVAGGDRGRLGVDRRHRVADVDAEAEALEEPGLDEGELLGRRAREERAEAHPVVGQPAFLAEGDDVPLGGGAPVEEDFEQLVADHAVADHDQRAAGGDLEGVHAVAPAPAAVFCPAAPKPFGMHGAESTGGGCSWGCVPVTGVRQGSLRADRGRVRLATRAPGRRGRPPPGPGVGGRRDRR